MHLLLIINKAQVERNVKGRRGSYTTAGGALGAPLAGAW